MSIFHHFFWVVLGIGLAVIFIKTQQWSVSVITPARPKLSKGLIIGGAIIRWLIITISLLITLNNSLLSMLILFFSFMLARMVIIFRQQRLLA